MMWTKCFLSLLGELSPQLQPLFHDLLVALGAASVVGKTMVRMVMVFFRDGRTCPP